MAELPSPTTAFSKLKELLMKLLPVFGVIVGIMAFSFIGKPIVKVIRDFMVNKLKFKQSSTSGAFVSGDFHELLWWVPAGIILGSITFVIGSFVKGFGGDIGAAIGNFMLGMGLGFLIGGVIIPFAEDIGLGFLKT